MKLLVLNYLKINQMIKVFQLHIMIVYSNQIHLIIILSKINHNKFRIKNKKLM